MLRTDSFMLANKGYMSNPWHDNKITNISHKSCIILADETPDEVNFWDTMTETVELERKCMQL